MKRMERKKINLPDRHLAPIRTCHGSSWAFQRNRRSIAEAPRIPTSAPSGAVPVIACNVSLQARRRASWCSRSSISMTYTDRAQEVSESGRDASRNHPRQGESRRLDALDALVIEYGNGYSIATGFCTSNRCYSISAQTHAPVNCFSRLNRNCARP
jgi:hypothetical protein